MHLLSDPILSERAATYILVNISAQQNKVKMLYTQIFDLESSGSDIPYLCRIT